MSKRNGIGLYDIRKLILLIKIAEGIEIKSLVAAALTRASPKRILSYSHASCVVISVIIWRLLLDGISYRTWVAARHTAFGVIPEGTSEEEEGFVICGPFY